MASDHRQWRSNHPQEREDTAENGGGRLVDEKIWKACAGSLVRIPVVNSTAYYFPQGHVEQSTPSIPMTSLSSHVKSLPFVRCRVEHVSYLADQETDEVLAKIRLLPVATCHPTNFGLESSGIGGDVEVEGDINDVVSFAKVLTASDANNGGGFSVPRFCADSIFPPLDFEKDPPVQNIRITDVHGKTFEFRHIYRGTPRRHLLTTGWSKFVNSKKLVAGDSVVFMRNKSNNKLFVGVRRAVKPVVVVNEGVFGNWTPPVGYVRKSGGGGGGGGGAKGRVAVEKVVEAVERAACGAEFEIVYYPKPGIGEYLVEAERVERASMVYWSEGVRVKMATETEDSSRVQWFQGVVVSAVVPKSGPFPGSTWRTLEVKWDEHEIPKNMNKVSPWQVECIPPTPPIHTTFPPTKKFKYQTNSGLFDGEGKFPLPSPGFSSIMGQLSSAYLNSNSFPEGMQGARQNNLIASNRHNSNSDSPRQINPEYYDNSVSQIVKDSSIDLNISKTPSDRPSPDSQNSVQLFCTAGTKQNSCDFTKNTGITSFQLFGTTIHMNQPLNSIDERSGTEYVTRGDGAVNTRDHPLAESYKKLHDKLGAQCDRSSVVG